MRSGFDNFDQKQYDNYAQEGYLDTQKLATKLAEVDQLNAEYLSVLEQKNPYTPLQAQKQSIESLLKSLNNALRQHTQKIDSSLQLLLIKLRLNHLLYFNKKYYDFLSQQALDSRVKRKLFSHLIQITELHTIEIKKLFALILTKCDELELKYRRQNAQEKINLITKKITEVSNLDAQITEFEKSIYNDVRVTGLGSPERSLPILTLANSPSKTRASRSSASSTTRMSTEDSESDDEEDSDEKKPEPSTSSMSIASTTVPSTPSEPLTTVIPVPVKPNPSLVSLPLSTIVTPLNEEELQPQGVMQMAWKSAKKDSWSAPGKLTLYGALSWLIVQASGYSSLIWGVIIPTGVSTGIGIAIMVAVYIGAALMLYALSKWCPAFFTRYFGSYFQDEAAENKALLSRIERLENRIISKPSPVRQYTAYIQQNFGAQPAGQPLPGGRNVPYPTQGGNTNPAFHQPAATPARPESSPIVETPATPGVRQALDFDSPLPLPPSRIKNMP